MNDRGDYLGLGSESGEPEPKVRGHGTQGCHQSANRSGRRCSSSFSGTSSQSEWSSEYFPSRSLTCTESLYNTSESEDSEADTICLLGVKEKSVEIEGQLWWRNHPDLEL